MAFYQHYNETMLKETLLAGLLQCGATLPAAGNKPTRNIIAPTGDDGQLRIYYYYFI